MTDPLAEIAIKELGRSMSLDEAIFRIAENSGHRFTKDALRGYLKRRGHKSPGSYLVEGLSIPVDTSAFDAEPLVRTATLECDPVAPSQYEFPALDCGSELERVLLVPDTHRPFHDKRAWATMLAAGKALRPHTIVFLGDYQDFYTVSAHDRDPRRGTQLLDEVKDGDEGLQEVQALNPERVIFHGGNHEDRLSRLLMQHAPALLGITGIPQLLKLSERGWHYVPYRQHARVGKLYTTHDVGYSGVNAARQTGAAFRHNVAFGHSHALRLDYFGSVTGERFVSANLGWLGDVAAADYCHEATKTNWQHGFGVGLVEKTGTVHLSGIPIIDGRCVVDGKLHSLKA